MSDQRYSVEIIVATHAFAESGWKSTLAVEECVGYGRKQ
jgi:hypothetical protein